MAKKRIFMYATHGTLVDHESYTFIKRGFDVYTAAWATDTRSMQSGPIEFNPKHPYQGKCHFLTDKDVAILSKIDVKSPYICPAGYHQEIQQTLLNNFDVLYVFQITPWLMLYAEEFLKLKRPVIFRTSGIPLWSWGHPHNYEKFWEYPTFYVLPSNPAELEFGSYQHMFKEHGARQIMISLQPELIDTTSKLESNNKFALSVDDTSPTNVEFIRSKLEKAIDFRMINRAVRFVPIAEVNKLFNSCYFFFDMTAGLLKYSVFEAILHNKPVLVLKDKSIHTFMRNTGLEVGLEYWHEGYDDTDKFKFYVDNPGALNRVFGAQKLWLIN